MIWIVIGASLRTGVVTSGIVAFCVLIVAVLVALGAGSAFAGFSLPLNLTFLEASGFGKAVAFASFSPPLVLIFLEGLDFGTLAASVTA